MSKCYVCNADPRNLKGQKFNHTATGLTVHMMCLQKEYMTNRNDLSVLSADTKAICNQYRDLIQRVDANFRGFTL